MSSGIGCRPGERGRGITMADIREKILQTLPGIDRGDTAVQLKSDHTGLEDPRSESGTGG
jgi:hypothetical protein